MKQSTFEFFACKHVHQWVVYSVDEEQIRKVRVYSVNSRTITLETNAPIDSDGIQGDRKSTETER